MHFPGDFIVLTEDAASLALQYLVKEPGSGIRSNQPSLLSG